MSIKINASYTEPHELVTLRVILGPLINAPGARIKKVQGKEGARFNRFYVLLPDNKVSEPEFTPPDADE